MRGWKGQQGQAPEGLEDKGKDLGFSVKPPESRNPGHNEVHVQQDLSREWMGVRKQQQSG